MSQSHDRELLIADTLHLVNDRLITLAIDTEHYAMALQAVKTSDPVATGIIQAVITCLFSNSMLATETSEQMDSLILMTELEATRYE
jgi:hypothetical protein